MMKNQDNAQKLGREEWEVLSPAVLTLLFDEFGSERLREPSGKKH